MTYSIVEEAHTTVLDAEGNPVAILRKNGHVLGFSTKEMTLDAFTKMLTALASKSETV